jgi:hypothetical protein
MVKESTIKKTYKQKPVPGTNLLVDLVTPALPPGWRISERTGKPYFENRENRSDTAAEIAAFVPKAKKPKTAKKATAKKAPAAKPKKQAAPKKAPVKKTATPKKAAPKKAKPRRKGQVSLF